MAESALINEFCISSLLKSYYSDLEKEYCSLSPNIIEDLVQKYFGNINLENELIKQSPMEIVSNACVPNNWKAPIYLKLFIHSTDVVEMYFLSIANLPTYVKYLMNDLNFKELAILIIHINFLTLNVEHQ